MKTINNPHCGWKVKEWVKYLILSLFIMGEESLK